uniref:Jasmonate O-methyltransferase n=2 Tax=Opuntia streptacantha TaxID=393608 RepID=A0A7C8YU91_OPUST
MDVRKLLHMKEGVGQNSYANNSSVQSNVTAYAKSSIEENIKEGYHALGPKCFMMADTGCSSGPNTLSVVSEAINVIDEACRSLQCKVPEFGVFLNDLPGNDFNTLFKFLPSFYKWVAEEKGSNFGPCFVSGTPRSFHERVFPCNFLHFVFSGYALHWLSQVDSTTGTQI